MKKWILHFILVMLGFGLVSAHQDDRYLYSYDVQCVEELGRPAKIEYTRHERSDNITMDFVMRNESSLYLNNGHLTGITSKAQFMKLNLQDQTIEQNYPGCKIILDNGTSDGSVPVITVYCYEARFVSGAYDVKLAFKFVSDPFHILQQTMSYVYDKKSKTIFGYTNNQKAFSYQKEARILQFLQKDCSMKIRFV
jgi:hypothetical protein